jgi:mevalonate kinase
MQICEYLPKELEEFPVVTKSPANFFLSGEHAVMFGMPALCQPITLYVYAGVRKIKDGGIKILNKNGQPGLYRPNPNAVQKIDFDFFRPVDVVNHIESLLTEEFPNKSAEICLYLTAPSACGLATSGATGAALSLALHWLFSSKKDREKIEKNIQDLSNLGRSLSKLIQVDTFKQIYRLAWKIDSIFHDYKSSGANAFTALVGSPHGLPIVYQCELRDGLYDNRKMSNTNVKPLSAKDSVGKIHFELYDKLDFFAKDIHEIEVNADARTFPLAVAIVYSGIEKQTNLAIRAACAATEDVMSSNMVQLTQVKDFSRMDIMSILGICSQKTIHSVIMFFQGNRERLQTIMNTTQTIQNVLRDFLGVSTTQIEEICKLVCTRGFSAKLTGGGTGGDVVILCSVEKIDALKGLLKELEDKGFSTHLKATSWGDREGTLWSPPGKLVKSEPYYNLLFFNTINSTGKENQVNKFFEGLNNKIKEVSGNFLKRIGDAAYISFPTSEDSIEYGKYLIDTAIGQGTEIRIGIHSSYENWPKGIHVPDKQCLSMSVVAQCQKKAKLYSIVISENVINELPLEKQNEFKEYEIIEKNYLKIKTYIKEYSLK